MRHVALTLSALAALGLATNTATAQTATLYPMAAEIAATLVTYHGGCYGGPYMYGGYGWYHPPVYAHPTVVVPFPGYPPVMHPPVYRAYPYPYGVYYSRPHTSFYYQGRGFAVGIGF